MAHRVWLGRPLETAGLVAARERGRAAILLVVEYCQPRHGDYRLKARIDVRDAGVMDLIRRHELAGIEVYADSEAEAAAKARTDLDGELASKLETRGLDYIWFAPHEMAADWVRGLRTRLREERAVRVTFGMLLAGIEVAGSLDEMTWIARELGQAIDRLAAKLDAGAAFEAGEVRVMAPGSKAKPAKSTAGKPPSQWGK